MSVLKSLKGTLASVQNDISSGIRSLGTKKDSADEMLRKTNGVDPDAGGGLLDKFQNTWTELHINSGTVSHPTPIYPLLPFHHWAWSGLTQIADDEYRRLSISV